MAATLPPLLMFQPLVAGVPLPGGKVYFYQAGTVTPQAAYAADGTTPLANPLTLDANGAAEFRLGSGLTYKIDVKDAVGAAISGWPIDNVEDADKGWMAAVDGVKTDLADSADVAKGDAMIAVKQLFAGAVARTQHDKNAEHLNVCDFGAVGDYDGVTGTDDTLAIQRAIDAIPQYQVLKINKSHKITSGLNITNKSHIRITGGGKITLVGGSSTEYIFELVGTCDDIEIDHLHLCGDNNPN